MDVSIVIVNYNTWELTVSCIRSILRYTEHVSYEIILIDNASVSFDATAFQREFPEVKLILNKENLGFSGANNQGVRQATGAYILLLNSDTYLTENAVHSMYLFMESAPDIGIASPRLIYPDGMHQSVAQRFPGIRYQVMELLRLQKIISNRQAGRLLLGAFFDHRETLQVDWVWGACMMFRKSVIDALPEGRLDESYFMYWEDVQWCWDVRKLGYKTYFFAGAEVVHIHGGSNGGKERLIAQNGNLFLERNYTSLHRKWIRKLQDWLQR